VFLLQVCYVAEKQLLRHFYFSIEELIFCVAVYDLFDGVFVSCNRVKISGDTLYSGRSRKTEIWRKFEKLGYWMTLA